jgi:hypothetical protein
MVSGQTIGGGKGIGQSVFIPGGAGGSGGGSALLIIAQEKPV